MNKMNKMNVKDKVSLSLYKSDLKTELAYIDN